MPSEAIEMTGTVREHHRGDLYLVDCQLGALRRQVMAKRSGRLITRHIFVVVGDLVTVEVNAYDTSKGRIVYRGARVQHT